MRKNIITLLLLICLVLASTSKDASNACPIQDNNIDITIKKQQIIPCLRHCLKKGWNECAQKVIQFGQAEHKQQLIKTLTEERKRLENLEELIVLGESLTEPVLKWGQNMTHIFITFKLSHRWDSPPCLNSKSEGSEISSRSLFYINVCLVSHQKVTFKLDLDLYKTIVVQGQKRQEASYNRRSNKRTQNIENSQILLDATQTTQTQNIIPPPKLDQPSLKFQIKKDGVGTYSTILQKLQPQIWLFLDRKMKNYAIWNQIGARYSQDLRTQQSLLEQYRALTKRQKKDSNIPKSQKQLKLYVLFTSALLIVMALLLM